MNNNEFKYTYKAPTEAEKREINDIRREYLQTNEKREETKLERLRRLDSSVKTPPLAIALSIGIVAILVFGLGLTTVLEWNNFYLGIPVACVGVVVMIVNYFIYRAIYKHQKNKHAPEILELTEELLNEQAEE